MSLIDELTAELRKRGGAQYVTPDENEAAEWRKAARAAARSLGRKVETVRVGNVTVASLKDWPANELEEQVTDARMRNVMERMNAKFLSAE